MEKNNQVTIQAHPKFDKFQKAINEGKLDQAKQILTDILEEAGDKLTFSPFLEMSRLLIEAQNITLRNYAAQLEQTLGDLKTIEQTKSGLDEAVSLQDIRSQIAN